MKLLNLILFLNSLFLFSSCENAPAKEETTFSEQDSIVSYIVNSDSIIPAPLASKNAAVPPEKIDSLVNFAESLIGIPYKYAAANPADGFDCSGFITYVFNHFNITVPRSSVDFTNVGQQIPISLAKKGDLILFTGTDSSIRIVGHMGIVIQNTDTLKFIHSSSGKQYGVTVTPLSSYYMGRFVKVIRYL